ncbi:MAG: FKBP-type peptidyl-prolyl cis-trans isomerase [Muribaculaceae bacterium]|nr:FKBP-type peptidyl-prolyl cis-trans isomerase [Muribaculaceae bacterium]MDE6628408.1 FKBP-type peptidyl-prolyl cis-trans isomerase [Muribaculaceae bacterium]
MKKLFFAAAAAAVISLAACSDDNDNSNIWTMYADWRQTNVNFVAEQEARLDEDGNPFYTRVTAPWAPNEYILMHWFNDRAETAGNLQPMYTSVVTASYNGRLYNDVMFDSSYTATDGQANFAVNSVIGGWQIALTAMRVGDTVQIVVPYQSGYGSSTTNSAIPPYSTLQFNLKLRDIPCYEIKP